MSVMPASARLPPRVSWLLIVGPVAFAVLGALVRYAAYASVAAEPSPQGFVGATCVWDCVWYGNIVQFGYQAHPETLNLNGPGGPANWAFFPLYPLLIAAVGKLIPAAPALLGAIVSPLLALGASLLAWPLFAGDRRGYLLFAVLLLAGPFSFYFSILYSESLFLILSVLAFVALGKRNYVAAGLTGAMLSATRTVGVLFIFALLIGIVTELREEGHRLRDMPHALLQRPDMLFALVAVPLGIFLFCIWLYWTTGDALAFLHIQRGWDRHLTDPFTAVWTALAVEQASLQETLRPLGLAAVAGLVLAVALAIERRYAEAVFCMLSLILALCSGVESMLRFVVALTPLNMLVAQTLGKWWIGFGLTVILCLVLDFELTIGWIRQHRALM